MFLVRRFNIVIISVVMASEGLTGSYIPGASYLKIQLFCAVQMVYLMYIFYV